LAIHIFLITMETMENLIIKWTFIMLSFYFQF
jgi:hypothetical protein